MPRELKCWNGGGLGIVSYKLAEQHGVGDPSSVTIYAAVHSRAELIRIIEAYTRGTASPGLKSSLRTHWAPHWGDRMQGITPEVGLWATFNWNDKPIRLWPTDIKETK